MNTEDVKIEFPKLIIASDKIFLIVAGRINNILNIPTKYLYHY